MNKWSAAIERNKQVRQLFSARLINWIPPVPDSAYEGPDWPTEKALRDLLPKMLETHSIADINMLFQRFAVRSIPELPVRLYGDFYYMALMCMRFGASPGVAWDEYRPLLHETDQHRWLLWYKPDDELVVTHDRRAATIALAVDGCEDVTGNDFFERRHGEYPNEFLKTNRAVRNLVYVAPHLLKDEEDGETSSL